MHDPTPAPYGLVTRRWTQLPPTSAAAAGARILRGGSCPKPSAAHVDRPGDDLGQCYAALVGAAAVGDELALSWLATSHRPLLIARGRALFNLDPSEWGAVCLEALHRALGQLDHTCGQWLRRRMALNVARRVSEESARSLARLDRERLTDPFLMDIRTSAQPAVDLDADLAIHLHGLLADLDAATRDGFLALAACEPLAAVAERHELTTNAMRVRLTRARAVLQPQLTNFVRAAAS